VAQINPNIPIIGNPVATEDPKVKTALEDIVDEINGKLDNTNIAAAGVANINGAKLLDASVAAAKLTTDSVETAKIVNDAVTNDKIGDDAVDTAQIADDAVENAQIADDAVDTAQIADGAVETAQIADGAVTNAKVTFTHETGTITYNSGYSALSSGDYSPLSITKNADGVVFISGGFSRTSSLSTLGTVGTLPEGFRPAGPIQLWGVNVFSGDTVSLQLLANGQLKTLYTSGTISGAGIVPASFRAA
jgi:hypothetical protein